MLRCAGCNRVIVDGEPEQMLAISCTCGIMSPILISEAEEVFSFPASLITFAVQDEPDAHPETYLGFSDHQSEIKTRLYAQLLSFGFIPMEHCDDEQCKKRIAFETARFAKPHYGLKPMGWRFVEVKTVFGEHHQDHFCVSEKFDVSVSNGLPGLPFSGWHLTIAPRCAHKQNSTRGGEAVYMPEVEVFFTLAGCTFTGPITSEIGLDTIHFHQLPIPKPRKE